MAIGASLALSYLAVLFATPEWRATSRVLLTRTPWRTIVRSAFDAFPTSHWRGAKRLIGVPFAWYFATLMFSVTALVLIGIEIAFSPRAIYCCAVRVSRYCRAWWSRPPNDRPPRAGALAMPKPEPPLAIDAVSRIRVSR